MDPTQSKMTLRFEIKSLEPQRKTIDTVPEIENLSPDLEAAIAVKFPGTTIEIRRAEGIPAVREIQELLLHIDWHAVASGAEKAIAAFATTEFLRLMKARFRNVFTKPAASATSGSQAAATPSAPAKRERSPRKEAAAETRKASGSPKKKGRASHKRRK